MLTVSGATVVFEDPREAVTTGRRMVVEAREGKSSAGFEDEVLRFADAGEMREAGRVLEQVGCRILGWVPLFDAPS